LFCQQFRVRFSSVRTYQLLVGLSARLADKQILFTSLLLLLRCALLLLLLLWWQEESSLFIIQKKTKKFI